MHNVPNFAGIGPHKAVSFNPIIRYAEIAMVGKNRR